MALVNARGRVIGYDEARSPSREPLSLVDPWNVSKASVRRTFRVQAAIAALFLISFLLYIPIGLAIIEPFERLTIQEVGRAPSSKHVRWLMDSFGVVVSAVPCSRPRRRLLLRDDEVRRRRH
jgi:hypothetical protein